MRRIQRGPVRGISFKLQEEERERRDNYVPETSAINISSIEVDSDTKDLLKEYNYGNLPNIVEAQAAPKETKEHSKKK